MRSHVGPLIPVAAVVVVAAVAHTAAVGVVDPWVALAFAAFVGFGELVRLTLPGERDAAPLGVAGALAYCLLPEVAGTPAEHGASQVVAVAAIGILVGGLPHAAAGRVVGLEDAARRLLVVAAAAAAFRPVVDPDAVGLDPGPGLAAVMIGVLLGVLILDALLAALSRASTERARLGATWRDELRTELSIGSAIGATGMLIALAVGVMDLWAIPVFCAPLLLTQFSFRRFVAIRETYLQTVRSLSRVTELGGYTETGHARRVSELALAVGRELGLAGDDLRDLEYAALMHDLGQLSLAEPIPGGATIMVDAGEQRRIAEEGARVIRATGVLDRVADMVERSTEPYRRPHEAMDPTLPLGASVIKAANAFDDLVGESTSSRVRLDALERLRLGMAYEYDPRVVAALSRVVERSLKSSV
ncbi:HD-GYP domain-containing protein [Sporichthya polymorpha]|uniref:HD-GYP domain-containing protein n=1 Tax=Sporichthya polymorpha TaxID=35751 RepID=UPI0003771521|nr:HD domain-containing phosphohydrolase [Sporichthya polymorpha]